MPEKRQAGDRQGGEYGLGSVRQRLEISRFLINETVGFTEPGRLNSIEIMLFGADIFLYDHINSTLLRTLGSKPTLVSRYFSPALFVRLRIIKVASFPHHNYLNPTNIYYPIPQTKKQTPQIPTTTMVFPPPPTETIGMSPSLSIEFPMLITSTQIGPTLASKCAKVRRLSVCFPLTHSNIPPSEWSCRNHILAHNRKMDAPRIRYKPLPQHPRHGTGP